MDCVQFDDVAMVGLARVDAPVAVDSEAIEDQLAPAMRRADWDKGLLYQLTGIATRRLWQEGTRPSDAAADAGRKVLEATDVDPADIGAMISTSVSKDFIEPSVASIAHGQLELPAETMNFDVGNACLGFLNGIEIIGNMIQRGLTDYGLVVCGESSRPVLEATIERLNRPDYDVSEMRDQLSTLTLGSAGAAMVLGPTADYPDAPRITGAVTRAATEHNDLCRGRRDWMVTDAARLLIHGLELADETFRAAADHLGWTPETLDHVAAHQVSATHTAKVAERLDLDLERFCKIYPDYGNCGPASIPLALSLMRDRNQIEAGDTIGLMGIGSGLNCTMMEMRW